MTLRLIQGGGGAAARRGAEQVAKKALADWYGHRDFCWTCATPDGVRCDAGAEIHGRFMAACSAARPPAPAGQLPGEVPLW